MGNEIRQKLIIEEIAKVDNVLEGVNKIKNSLSGLSVPKDLQRQFDEIYKKIIDQSDKAKRAASSGFETRGSVKSFTDALRTISNLYSDLETKAGRLEVEKIAFGDAKGYKTAIDQLKALGEEFVELQEQADGFKEKIGKLVNTGANKYGGRRGAFDEWKQAFTAFDENRLEDAKKLIEQIGQKLEAIKNSGVDIENSNKWKGKLQLYEELKAAFADYEQKQQEAVGKETEFLNKQQQFNDKLQDTRVRLDGVNVATKEAREGAQKLANTEGQVVSEAQRLNSEMEHFKNKAAYFFGIANAINLFKRAVRSAYDTVKDLDAVMTETAVVTNFDIGDMWSQLPEYTQRANELGVTIHDTYEAATLFYQQGLKTNEVMAISNETLKMARIAGLDAATASDRMTNALRGFNMELDKTSAQRVNDVYSKLAAITASNTDEISTAMTKVASLAHNANMEFETTAAFLAQIIESTRESAETAGTALKTVVARFSEVKKLYSKGELLGQDEEGEEIDVNKVSTALRSAGINLNEYLTGVKGLDDIFIELAEKWDSLDQVQQRYIATMAAGSRQQSRFIALMSNYKRTAQLVEAANNANGASNEQYGKTLDSLQTKLARLKNAWNEFILGLTNSDAIKGAITLLTNLITAINKLISAISGKNSGIKMITTFFATFTAFKIGQKAIGKGGIMTKFFEKLVGDSGVAIGLTSKQISELFYKSLATKLIATSDYIKDTGGIAGALQTSLYGVFSKAMLHFDPLFELKRNLDKGLTNEGDWKQLQSTLNKEHLTLDQLNASLAANNQNIVITKENAAQYGLVVDENNEILNKNNNISKAVATATIGIGLALMAVTDKLVESGKISKEAGTWLKGLSVSLIAFGTIMSVVIPLHAQLMAQGVSTAIYSIPIIGWITAVISLFIGLITIITKFAKDNSAEAKLEKATDDLKKASEAADEAREAYEKLGQAWEDLDDKYDAIKQATKGTQEWRDAVKEVNTAVLDLIDTYGNINIYRDDDGILHIDEKEKEKLDKQIAENAVNASAAEKVAKTVQIRRQQDIDFNKMSDDVFYYDFISELQDKELEQLADMKIEDIQGFANERWGATVNGEVFNENEAKAVREYARSYSNQEGNVRAQRAALGADIFQGANFDKEAYGKYANAFLDDRYIDRMTKNAEEELKLDSKDDSQIKQLYAEAKHYDSYEKYKNDHPDEEIDVDGMKDFIIGANVVSKSIKGLEGFVSNIDGLEDYQKDFFTGGLTKQDLISFKGYGEKNIEDLYKKAGGDAYFGEGGLKDFIQHFYEEIGEAESSFKLDKFKVDEFKDNLSTELTNGLTSDTFKGLVDNLWSVYASSGIDGMNTVQESISKMAKEVEPDKINDFIKSLQSVNWKSADSVRTLTELAKEYGVSEDVIKEFENQVIDLNNATSKVDLEGLTSVLGIAKKIGNGDQGRSFSKDDYEELIQKGVASKDDFVYNIETGNYDYIGKDIEDVRAAIIEQTKILSGQLEKELGSDEAVQKTKDQLGEVENVENEGELTAFLRKYIDNAGDDSLINTSVLGGTLEQKQAAYNQIMEAYSREADTREQLGQVNAGLYQNNTAAENIGLIQSTNSEDARKALLQQISTSGLPEEVISTFIAAIENVPVNASAENGYLSHNGEMVGNVMTTLDEASEFGISAEDLNEYVEALKQVDNLENEQIDILYELALANAKYLQGLEKVTNSYDDWIELKQEDGSIKPEEGNDVQSKAYTQLKKDLKEMLNLSEDVSDEFMQLPGTAELLERAVNGDTDAVIELRKNIAKLDVMNSAKIAEGAKAGIIDAIDDLSENSTELEFGATLNDSEFAQGLADTLEAAGVAGDQIKKIFEDLGWAPEIEYEWVDFEDVQKNNTSGWQEIITDQEKGTKQRVPVNGLQEYAVDHKVMIPKVGKATYVKPSMPSTSKKSSKSSGSGGGGGSTKKPSYWKNPYDELYNLQEKINEALRRREALERRYQKLLKQEQATLADIRKSYYAQINNLRTEADLQKQFAAGRLRQIQNVGSQIYTDDEGNRKSFSSLGVTKYASYNANTGLIQIDWNGLEAIANNSSREEEGKAAEAYISKLEELVSSYEEVRDKLWEIEDKIEDLRDAAIDSYLSFEDRVKEALVNSYQQQIDSYQAMSDAIEKANSEVIDSLREQIDLSRQIRDNTEKEKDISDMENRLAYLQRDTSGANALEILKLQKDLENAREGYADTLVDQAIDKMQNDADLAAEQRARQIETMQEQLEIMQNTGALWDNVYKLMNDAAEGDGALSPHSNLVKLLQETEAFASLSNIGQAKWWSEVAEEFHAAWVGLSEAEDKYKKDANNDGTIYDSGTKNAIEEVQQAPATQPEPTTTTDTKPGYDEKTKYGVALAVCDGYWGNGDTRRRNLESKGFNYSEIQSIVNKVLKSSQNGSWYGKYYGITDVSQYKMSKFKTGGLADFTGPAWLDGTKSRPELILNAQDSANFIALKDILASLLNVQGPGGALRGGDNYYDVDITASIGSDYDVDRLAKRIKEDIYQDGQYRNVNTLSYLR